MNKIYKMNKKENSKNKFKNNTSKNKHIQRIQRQLKKE